MEGYIKLYRQLLSSSIFASQIGLKIWIWCLLKANFKTKFVSIKIGRGESVVEVGRGSFIFGRFVAEDELNIDGSTIYKWIKKLEVEGMIRIKSSSHYSIITICNYDSYQQGGGDGVTAIQQPSSSQVAATQQPSSSQVAATQQQSNTTKKEKKDNKEKNYRELLLSEIKISDHENINPVYYEIAISFQNLFRENLKQSGASTKTLDSMKGGAIDDVRLMIESDGYKIEDLRQAYKFLQIDDFWKTNIYSVSKLRKQMAQLKLKMSNNGKTKRDYKEGTTFEELAAVIQSKFPA